MPKHNFKSCGTLMTLGLPLNRISVMVRSAYAWVVLTRFVTMIRFITLCKSSLTYKQILVEDPEGGKK